MTLRQSYEHLSMEGREPGWNRFADHLTDTGMPPFVHCVSPLEGAGEGLKPSAFGRAEDPILPRMKSPVAPYVSARGGYGSGRSGRIHSPVAGVSESLYQPPRTIPVSHSRSQQRTLAARTHGFSGRGYGEGSEFMTDHRRGGRKVWPRGAWLDVVPGLGPEWRVVRVERTREPKELRVGVERAPGSRAAMP